MATQLIAATTGASTSADITVTATTPTGISCYGFVTGSEFVGIVDKKNSDASYDELFAVINPSHKPVRVELTGLFRSFTITKPGVYRIRKYATPGATIGVDTD